MKQSIIERAFGRWLVVCLLGLLLLMPGAGFSHTGYHTHESKMVPICYSCEIQHQPVIATWFAPRAPGW